MKEFFKGAFALIIMAIAFVIANHFILSVLKAAIRINIVNNVFEELFAAMYSTAWLAFLTFLLPYDIRKTTRWITGILAAIYVIGIIVSVLEMKDSLFIASLFNAVFLIVYFKVSNAYKTLTKIDEDGNENVIIPRKRFTFGTAIFTIMYALLCSLGIIFSVAAFSLFQKLPVWTILLFLPIFELFLLSLIHSGSEALGNYFEHRFPVFPAVSRIILIHAVISIVIIFVVFVFLIVDDNGFWRQLANIAIGLLAFRIFSNLIFPYIDAISNK
jgi:hypothetical protein